MPEQRTEIHIRPSSAGGWVTSNGHPPVHHEHSSKAEAISEGRRLAEAEQPSRLVVHRPDGSVEDEIELGDGAAQPASAPRAEAAAAEPIPTPPSAEPRKPGRARTEVPGVRSRVAISGHPVHPMLVGFPVTLLGLALPVADIGFLISQDSFWARGAFYVLIAGLVTALLAAGVGMVDFMGIRRARAHREGWYHLLANLGVLGLAFVNLLARIGDREAGAVPAGIILSLVTAGLIVFSGWNGGELIYRHKVGVSGNAGRGGRR